MSSSQRGQAGTASSFELGSKKKFGKNLNKLQKPPAPPITNGATQRGSASSRNGLLLLSTKRASSSSGNSGLLSSKPAPSLVAATVAPVPTAATTATKSATSTQPVSIRNESYTSAHDALVDAVMGASRNDAQKEPAWGVADEGSSNTTTKALAPGGGVTSSREREVIYNGDDRKPPENRQRRYNRHETDDSSWRRSESDESWRRNQSTEEVVDNDQAQYMARLARERAERRRLEEETRMNEQRERAATRLRELENKIGDGAAVETSARNSVKRTLYDPSRPFSSLLGGGVSNAAENEAENVTPEPVAAEQNEAPVDNSQPTGPVIHLASYEDRDRGERTASAAPRMLYDPKSGSMVAVSDKAKKGKQKGRGDKGDNGDAGTNGKKKKGRNDSTSTQKKDRRRGELVEMGSPADEAKSAKPRKARPAANRLPRTCGVLYVRDEKGNCSASDNCDGDQGYGCHGVPGGRMRNPVAFAKFQEEQATQENEAVQEDYGTGMEDEQEQQHDEQMLQGYLSPAKVQEPVIDWVKPNEKIELLTGVQDSPTLKPTAVPFAPSQAALAAAAAAKEVTETPTKSNASVDSGLNHSTEDEDDGLDDDPVSIRCRLSGSIRPVVFSPLISFVHNIDCLYWSGF